MFKATNNVPFVAQRGLHVFNAIVATGPVVLSVSDDNGVSFTPMTDGSFTAGADGTVVLADDMQYRASIPGGDSLALAPADTGISVDPKDA